MVTVDKRCCFLAIGDSMQKFIVATQNGLTAHVICVLPTLMKRPRNYDKNSEYCRKILKKYANQSLFSFCLQCLSKFCEKWRPCMGIRRKQSKKIPNAFAASLKLKLTLSLLLDRIRPSRSLRVYWLYFSIRQLKKTACASHKNQTIWSSQVSSVLQCREKLVY